MTVYLDITQLILDPRRTGIQRAERELMRHWPGPAPLVPCAFVDGVMRRLPDALLAAFREDAPSGGVAAELRRIGPLLTPGRTVPREARLLSAELFSNGARAAYYAHLASPSVYWLVYDFLPWLHPNWFGVGGPRQLMPYLHALRCIPNVAFISGQTRDEYEHRVVRRPATGPVVPLGGDSLGLERQSFHAGRRRFVTLGTIEPRKNVAAVMRAFQLLWAEGVKAELTVIGATDPDGAVELALLDALAAEPQFRHLAHANDAEVRDTLRSARALVFPSQGEGFGIPPLEALHAGIPAVIHAGLPAAVDLPPLGQVRLERVDDDSIRHAVLALLDDDAASRLWADAATLRVPTWRDFAVALAGWVQA